MEGIDVRLAPQLPGKPAAGTGASVQVVTDEALGLRGLDSHVSRV